MTELATVKTPNTNGQQMNPLLKRRWLDLIIALLGTWLIASTWALQVWTQSTLAAWISVGTGALVVSVALLDLRRPTVWDEWMLFTLGGCLAFSPLLLEYGTAHSAEIQAVVAGLLLIILTTAAGNIRHWREDPAPSQRAGE